MTSGDDHPANIDGILLGWAAGFSPRAVSLPHLSVCLVCVVCVVCVASCMPTSWASQSWRAAAHRKSWSLCSTSSLADSMTSPRWQIPAHPAQNRNFYFFSKGRFVWVLNRLIPDSLLSVFSSTRRRMGVFALRSWVTATTVCLVYLTPFPHTPGTVFGWVWTCALPSGQFSPPMLFYLLFFTFRIIYNCIYGIRFCCVLSLCNMPFFPATKAIQCY